MSPLTRRASREGMHAPVAWEQCEWHTPFVQEAIGAGGPGIPFAFCSHRSVCIGKRTAHHPSKFPSKYLMGDDGSREQPSISSHNPTRGCWCTETQKMER